jgi:hypothetical protein
LPTPPAQPDDPRWDQDQGAPAVPIAGDLPVEEDPDGAADEPQAAGAPGGIMRHATLGNGLLFAAGVGLAVPTVPAVAAISVGVVAYRTVKAGVQMLGLVE